MINFVRNGEVVMTEKDNGEVDFKITEDKKKAEQEEAKKEEK